MMFDCEMMELWHKRYLRIHQRAGLTKTMAILGAMVAMGSMNSIDYRSVV